MNKTDIGLFTVIKIFFVVLVCDFMNIPKKKMKKVMTFSRKKSEL